MGKKCVIVGMIIGLMLMAVGCTDSKVDVTNSVYGKENKTVTTTEKVEDNTPIETKKTVTTDMEKTSPAETIEGLASYTEQFEMPEKGEEVVVMTTNHGVIKVRLFEEVAPKAVENFKTHAQEGYYDGLSFHRVMNDFMIQGGDPEGTGRGGESIYGKAFEDEFSKYLLPYRGALCMANSGPNTNGSQFFIVQKKEVDTGVAAGLRSGGWPEEIINNFEEYGGTHWLAFKHTTFGQVYEGMEVVDEIATVKTDTNDKPVEGVIIEKIEIVKFEG